MRRIAYIVSFTNKKLGVQFWIGPGYNDVEDYEDAAKYGTGGDAGMAAEDRLADMNSKGWKYTVFRLVMELTEI